MGKRLTVKEIARLSGVSVATVSRVINQNGRFSAQTEERVRSVIEKYDYHPNQLARGLRVSKTRTIGIIIPDITSPFFTELTLEIQKRLLEHDYLTLICNTNEVEELEHKQLNMLYAQQVSGVIYVLGSSHMHVKDSIPMVFIDRKPRNLGTNHMFIESDNEMGGRIAAKALIHSGCRKIACVTFDDGISVYSNRVRGFLEAVQESGIAHRVYSVGRVPQSRAQSAGFKALRALWESERDIDGLFCATDALAIGAMHFCYESGIPIPGSMRLIGFDDVPLCKAIYPALTTVRQSPADFADIAVRSMMDLIGGTKPDKMYCRLPVELIRRGTI